MSAPQLVTGPTSPVSLEEAKAHLRVDFDGSSPGFDDDVIAAFIEAAVSHIDGPNGLLRQSVLGATWVATLDEFPEGEIVLPLTPVADVVIDYDDADGAEQTLDDEAYTVDAYGGRIKPVNEWPTTEDEAINAVRIEWTAGPAECPAAIRAAILLMIGHLYAHRGDGDAEVPAAINILLRPWMRLVMS